MVVDPGASARSVLRTSDRTSAQIAERPSAARKKFPELAGLKGAQISADPWRVIFNIVLALAAAVVSIALALAAHGR